MLPSAGRLWLIPNLIAPGSPETALPPATLDRVRTLRRFVVEGERAGWRFLSAILERPALDLVEFSVLDEHTAMEEIERLLAPALAGEDLGLISEEGMPCIADPGAPLVALAHERGIRVIPLVGPSSIFLALAASGLDGQHFSFLGYLPSDREGRRAALRAIDRGIAEDGATRIFIEAPYRNDHLLEDCLACLSPQTRLCVAKNIGAPDESILQGRVSALRQTPAPIGKSPTIFLAGMVPGLVLDRPPPPRNSQLKRIHEGRK